MKEIKPYTFGYCWDGNPLDKIPCIFIYEDFQGSYNCLCNFPEFSSIDVLPFSHFEQAKPTEESKYFTDFIQQIYKAIK